MRAIWVVFALTFFAAGVSKLRHSGLEWIFSDNMAISLIAAQYHTHNVDPLTTWGLYLAQHTWLLHLVAAGTIVFEVSYPLALFSSKARWVIVPGVFFMLVGVRLLLGPTFDQYLICHLFWVPWERFSRYRLIEGFQDVLLSLRKLPKTLRRRY